MKFVFIEKDEIETEILLDILKSENIRFKTELAYTNYNEKFYDISINVEVEKYLYIEYLLEKKLEPYRIAEKSFEMDEYINDREGEKRINTDDIRRALEYKARKFFQEEKNIVHMPPFPTRIDIIIPLKKSKTTMLKDKFLNWLFRGEKD